MNGEHNLPDWIPEPNKTIVFDRCQLLGPMHCPTRNGFAASSVAHKIPGLTEHFLYTDDDNLLTLPASPSTFYHDSGKPRVWARTRVQSSCYDQPTRTGLAYNQIPGTYRYPYHMWVPLSKSSLEKFEASYSRFFAFLRSHLSGRYSSRLNEYGTQKSEDANSNEEDVMGIWQWWLLSQGHGERSTVPKVDKTIDDTRMNTYDRVHWEAVFANPPLFVNINDDLPGGTPASSVSRNTPEKYAAAHQVMIGTLERYFPPFGLSPEAKAEWDTGIVRKRDLEYERLRRINYAWPI